MTCIVQCLLLHRFSHRTGVNDALAKTTPPLTHTQIERASPKAKEYTLADGFGLLLRIKPNGRKSWLFNYQRPFSLRRYKNSREKRAKEEYSRGEIKRVMKEGREGGPVAALRLFLAANVG